MQKKYLVLIIALIIISGASRAIASSPSPSPSSSDISQDNAELINENIKKRVQELNDSNSESTSSSVISARAYIGIVKDVISGTVIIEDKDGKKDIKLTDATSIIRTPGNVIIKVDNIRIDDHIIAIGYPGEDDTLVGRRIIVSVDPIKSPSKTSGLGTINKISKSSLTLQIGDTEKIIDLTSKTIYKTAAGTIELSELSVGDTLIYAATIGKDEDLTATILMRIQTSAIDESK